MFKWKANEQQKNLSQDAREPVSLQNERPKSVRVQTPEEQSYAYASVQQASDERKYLMLEDAETKIHYYMDVVDTFMVGEKTYSAMLPYEQKKQNKEEIVIMRIETDKASPLGYRYFSVADQKELQEAFDVFFLRYESMRR